MFKSGRNLFLNFFYKEGEVKEKLFLGGFDWRFHVAGCKIPSDFFLGLLAMIFHIGLHRNIFWVM